MRAIVGLGNPGSEYELTRHNAGFMLADLLADRWHFAAFRRPWRWRARVAKGTVGNETVVVVKPQTYMNRSGTALTPLLRESAFDPRTDLLVLVDEVALPFGSMRIRPHGSDGGHNGLRSIAGRLQSHDYARLRIGVGPKPDDRQADYLLSPFTDDELGSLEHVLPRCADAVDCWLHEGVETAMNRFNRKGTSA